MPKTYNTIPTVSTGDVYTATAHNAIGTTINSMRVPPSCMLQVTADATVTNNFTASWNTTPVVDTDGMFSAGTPTRMTVQTAGLYLVSAQISLGAATAISLPYIYIGKSDPFGYASMIGTNDGTTTRLSITTVMNMAAGEMIQVAAGWASATGAVTLQGTTDGGRRARFQAVWLGQVS
jgi:hypothetical protein